MATITRMPICFFVRSTRASHVLAQVCSDVSQELNKIKDAGTFKTERIITSAQSVEIGVVGQKQLLLNFCANNYLGLSNDAEVVRASVEALKTHGAGLSSVRFICGTQDIHRSLEKKIARFHSRDDSILYAACFDANAGLFEVLFGKEDAILSDELNHASIIDGVRLCKAQKKVYKHMDMEDLERQLVAVKECRRRLIATDGVFSMDGHVAPLKDICDLADKHNAMVFIDECHATGFFGPTGRGTEEYYGMKNRVDIINSTLGKALGGAMGGYTTGPQVLVDLLRQRARPYLFSNSLAPAVVGGASKVFDMLMASSHLIQSLADKITRFRSKMQNAGFNIGGNAHHPICPVMLGDAKLANDFAERMLAHGIYVIGFSYPVVPVGKARIRVQISAAHSNQDIDRAVEVFAMVGKEMGVIGK